MKENLRGRLCADLTRWEVFMSNDIGHLTMLLSACRPLVSISCHGIVLAGQAGQVG